MFSAEEILTEFIEAANYTPLKTKPLRVGDLLIESRLLAQAKIDKNKWLRSFPCLVPVGGTQTRPCTCGGAWELRKGCTREYHVGKRAGDCK